MVGSLGMAGLATVSSRARKKAVDVEVDADAEYALEFRAGMAEAEGELEGEGQGEGKGEGEGQGHAEVIDPMSALKSVTSQLLGDQRLMTFTAGAYTHPLLSSIPGLMVSEPFCVKFATRYEPCICIYPTYPTNGAYVELRSGRV